MYETFAMLKPNATFSLDELEGIVRAVAVQEALKFHGLVESCA